MHGLAFLQDLAVVMLVAGVVTLLFHRLRQPVVLGYLLAGLIIGPHTPPAPLISDPETIDTLAQLGIICLMFSLGLEFNLRKLTQVGAPAILAALLEIVVMFWIGYEIGRFFAWAPMNCVFLGAMLSMSSTTVIIKVLSDMGRMKERFSELIFGILILEDILGIAMIALLSGIARTGGLHALDVAVTLGKLGVFLAVLIVGGLLVVPRLIGYIARFRNDEMLVIAVLGLCFGVSLLALKLGYSVALGAFLIGAIIAEAREIHRVAALIAPVRDMFSAVFFVAIGMLIDPAMLVRHALPIAVITLAVVAGKVVACSAGAFIGGTDGRTALRVGMGLAQIGEFSFIIAALGQSLHVTDAFLYPIAVAVSAVTTLLTPYLIRGTDPAVRVFSRVAPRSAVHALTLYTGWAATLRRVSRGDPGWRVVRSVAAQIALNILLVIGIFVAGALAVRAIQGAVPWLEDRPQAARYASWTAAVFVALPIYVATLRKLQALGMMLAELSLSAGPADARRQTLRSVLSTIILAVGALALGVLTLVLSSAILPSGPIIFALMAAVLLVALLYGAHFNRLYSRAKFALVETWNQPHQPEPAGRELPELLHDAELQTVPVPPGALHGRLIRELALRSRSGASIVAIERAGRRTVNPGPDEELLAGDQLLLLGTADQIARARDLMGDGGSGARG